MRLSRVTEKINPSLTRALFNKAKEYDGVIDLTLGDPDFFTASNVSEAGIKAIKEGKTKYTMNAGLPELRKAISESIYKDTGVRYDHESEVMVTVGAMGALYLSIKCLLDPGDEVIIPAPYWINYVQQVAMSGGVPVIVDSYEEDDFALRVENIEKAITDKTRAIIINTPNNPTGQILSKDVLKDIADIAKKYDLVVIADEVYKSLIFDDYKFESIVEIEDMKERVVLINSFSKTYSMTGWRMGYCASVPELIAKMTAMQENVCSCSPMISQFAGIEALRGPQEYTRYMAEQFKVRRDILIDGISDIDKLSCKKPKGTFYAFVNIKKTGLKSEEFAYDLLDKQQVAVVPGITYGQAGEGYIRIAYTQNEEKMREAVKRIEKYIKSL